MATMVMATTTTDNNDDDEEEGHASGPMVRDLGTGLRQQGGGGGWRHGTQDADSASQALLGTCFL